MFTPPRRGDQPSAPGAFSLRPVKRAKPVKPG
jgi:hypothetical protein